MWEKGGTYVGIGFIQGSLERDKKSIFEKNEKRKKKKQFKKAEKSRKVLTAFLFLP